MNIMDYIAIGIGAVIAAIMIIAFVVTFAKASPEKRYATINQILYALAVEAERLYGSKTGEVKKKQVVAWFYERYKWLSFFVTEEELNEWIDSVVDSLNDWLQSNPVGAKNLIGKEVPEKEIILDLTEE